MKKKVLLISGVLLTLIIIGSIILIISQNKQNNEIVMKDNKNTINNSFLTLMLEQEDGTYQESTSNTWPNGNYAFNESLSSCENGGELRWNRENGIVELLSNKSDACYVYFDLYNRVEITNIETSATYNSITVTVTTETGENPVDKYYFSIDGGNSYQESISNIYTFQNLNYGTEYTIKVYVKDTVGNESFQEEVTAKTNNYVKPGISSVIITGTTTNSISVSVNANGGVNSISTYHYSINNGGYTSSSSSTHTFNGLGIGTTYTIRVYVTDTAGVTSDIATVTGQTSRMLLADYIKSQYTSQGANGLYYHTSSLSNSAADNSYRYAGSDDVVNNYICFGSNSGYCSYGNTYRIIGLFDNEVKIIKNQSIGNYAWDSENDNTWISSNRPDIYTTLNNTFLNGLNSTWSSKIATHGWKVGGIDYSSYTYTPRTLYNYEVGSRSSGTTDSMKIGLMYVSDFGYAANPAYWTTTFQNYENAANDNWLAGIDEWTISTVSDRNGDVFYIMSTGYVRTDDLYQLDDLIGVRPAFYLNSNVTYVSGSGTSTDPIRIN